MIRSLLLVALALAVVVTGARVVVGGRTWDDPGYQTEIAPPRLAAANHVLHGEPPSWFDGAGLGVPLLAEPSHGAAYPALWLAATPYALDIILVLHMVWAALGIALWLRRAGHSDKTVPTVALIVATTALLASTAIGGALPAVAHVPWIGWATTRLTASQTTRERASSAVMLGVFVAAIALAGQLGVVLDAIAIAVVLGANRRTVGWLAAGLVGGLAIGAVQWLPAALLDTAGSHASALPPARWLDVMVPGSSLYAGVVVVFAAVRRPPWRVAVALAVCVVAAIRAWGAPEAHLAVAMTVAAPAVAVGLDAVLAGERRAILTLATGGVVLAILAVVGAGSIVAGAIASGCLGGAAFVAWRLAKPWWVVAPIALCAILSKPIGESTIDRAIVDAEPAWATAGAVAPPPRRLFHPVHMFDQSSSVDEAIATLAGTVGARWGIATARTDDPARAPLADRVWLAAAHGGGELLDRFGIELAILPVEVVGTIHLEELGRRGRWALVRYPAAPAASVMHNWLWRADPADALYELFAAHGRRGLGRGRIVLAGRGEPNEDESTEPTACTIERWHGGAIDLTCETPRAAYAVVSSSAAPGWTVEVDGEPASWVTADVMRRAVALPAGTHHVRWRYATPGLGAGLLVAGFGSLLLFGLYVRGKRSSDPAVTRSSTSLSLGETTALR